MILIYAYFIVNLILVGKIVWNLNTKFKDDKEAWSDARMFIALTALFGTVLLVKTWLAERNN